MEEIWKPIPGFSKYKVSNLGQIKSLIFKKEKILKQAMIYDGYKFVTIANDKMEKKTMLVHRAVAFAFLGPCPEGAIVCHNDGNKTNNVPENLRYDTHCNNLYEAAVERHSRIGEEDITLNLAKAIKMDILAKKSYLDIATRYSITRLSVEKIARGELFKELHEEVKRIFIL